MVVDIPKDVQFATGTYSRPTSNQHKTYRPQVKGEMAKIKAALEMMKGAKKPIFYTGGGVINSGPEACALLRELVRTTGFPITSTLMGLGAYPASDRQWLGMLGMHGTYEANLAMHDCDVMIAIGARFDDRITGRLDAFSPNSQKIHIDIDPSSINKNVRVDLAIVGDSAHVLEDMVRLWRSEHAAADKAALKSWWDQIDALARAQLPRLPASDEIIKPQYAVAAALRADQGSRHLHHHRGRPAPDVGGAVPQVRGAQPLDDLRRPRHHGLRPAGGDRRADRPSRRAGDRHRRRSLDPDDHAGNVDGRAVPPAGQESSSSTTSTWAWCASGRSCCTASAIRRPIRRACRTSSSWPRPTTPRGIRCDKPAELDAAILEMIDYDGPVLFDCIVDPAENCFPMIPSGKAHNEMILGDAVKDIGSIIDDEGQDARLTPSFAARPATTRCGGRLRLPPRAGAPPAPIDFDAEFQP